eukprot:Hpha_TRINITY_DN15308_c0_g1::TRINITY_DN15308_c0_g1_i1::g.87600::m.87600
MGDPDQDYPQDYVDDEDVDDLVNADETAQIHLQRAAGTFTATSCPSCDQVFQVEIDFEEVRDNVEFERLKRKELEAQKESYKQEITKSQEDLNALKETLANLCNQLAQAQVDNLRAKHEASDRDAYISQLKEHLQESEGELFHLAQDFSVSLKRNKELYAAHLRNTGQVPPQVFKSGTARKIVGGVGALPGPDLGPLVGEPLSGSVESAVPALPPDVAQDQMKKREWYRQRLLQFYAIHRPEKMGEVDSILSEFQGHEEQMLVMLAKKYSAPQILAPGQSPDGGGLFADQTDLRSPVTRTSSRGSAPPQVIRRAV